MSIEIWKWISPFIVSIVVLLMMAYMTYAERKILGWIQLRQGPSRVGPLGLLQPIVDAIKLIAKQPITPQAAYKSIYRIAPFISFFTSIFVWSLIPVGLSHSFVDCDLSLLWTFTISSLGVYGIVMAGWSSNSKYALLGAMRSVTQVISYEIVMSLIFLAILIVAGSSRLDDIVQTQSSGFLSWYGVKYFPLFILYLVCGFAETNRAPFDIAEGESELVAGYHVEYGGWSFALFFLAEYINMIVISAIGSILFLGGHFSPLGMMLPEGPVWIVLKMSTILWLFIWVRGTLPRYRFDQLLVLGWTRLIPMAVFFLLCISAIESTAFLL